MTDQRKKEYNEWYWNIIVQSSLSRILPLCKQTDKNFVWIPTKENFLELIKYLETWEKTYPGMDDAIRRDLESIRNFHGYEELVAA
jgi:hypothetical protein